MTMDITEITTMLGTIVGIITPLGGVGAWLYRKQTNHLRDRQRELVAAAERERPHPADGRGGERARSLQDMEMLARAHLT